MLMRQSRRSFKRHLASGMETLTRIHLDIGLSSFLSQSANVSLSSEKSKETKNTGFRMFQVFVGLSATGPGFERDRLQLSNLSTTQMA